MLESASCFPRFLQKDDLCANFLLEQATIELVIIPDPLPDLGKFFHADEMGYVRCQSATGTLPF